MNDMWIRLICLLLAVSVFSGCAQYEWQKRGGTTNNLNKDLYKCQTEAAKTFPTYMVTGQDRAGFADQSSTICYSNTLHAGDSSAGKVMCTTSPGLTTRDANDENREQATDQCMKARGWKLIQKSK